MRCLFRVLTPLVIVSYGAVAQTLGPVASPGTLLPAGAVKAGISYAAARPVLDVMRDHLPAELRGKPPAEIEGAWPGWVARRDGEIRARLERGDEDSLVNLWLYGTTFTDLPPARDRDLATLAGRLSIAEVLEGRLEDMVAGIVSPGTNERLRFARLVVDRQGIDPASVAGRREVRRFFIEARERVLAEFAATDRLIDSARASARLHNDPSFEIAAYAAIFRDRGFASDTSLLPGFGIEQVLEVIGSERLLDKGSVRRVAIVGPGLDFINKADGYDFYPPQTIQPFALIDSLIRLGLAKADGLRVTGFDVNPMVNGHLEAMGERAGTGGGYVLQLPLNRVERWDPALVTYWERFGDRVGEEVQAQRAPDSLNGITVRAVRLRPDVVLSVSAHDLNIVLERLEPLAEDERFDLIVATNILVYYEPFEQSLALANAAAMLRAGGVFIANSGVVPAPPMRPAVGYAQTVYSDRQYDHMFWYQRD